MICYSHTELVDTLFIQYITSHIISSEYILKEKGSKSCYSPPQPRILNPSQEDKAKLRHVS